MSEMQAPANDGLDLRALASPSITRMGEAGILRADERVELLNGRIVEVPPIGPDHAYVVTHVADLVHHRLRGEIFVRSQLPLPLGPYSEPEPNLALVRGRAERYQRAHPAQTMCCPSSKVRTRRLHTIAVQSSLRTRQAGSASTGS